MYSAAPYECTKLRRLAHSSLVTSLPENNALLKDNILSNHAEAETLQGLWLGLVPSLNNSFWLSWPFSHVRKTKPDDRHLTQKNDKGLQARRGETSCKTLYEVILPCGLLLLVWTLCHGIL